MEEIQETAIGAASSRLGIHSGNIIQQFSQLSIDQITNELMLELHSFAIKKKSVSVKKLYEMVCEKYGVHFPESTFRTSIKTISDTSKRLKKTTKTEEQKKRPEQFLNAQYEIPVSQKRKHEENVHVMNVKKQRKHDQSPVRDIQTENEMLREENIRLKAENERLKHKLNIVYGAAKKRQEPKRFFESYKRKCKAASTWRNKYYQECAKRKADQKKDKPIIIRKGVSQAVHTVTSDALSNTISRLRTAEETNKELENKVEELKETINEQQKPIETRIDGTKINPKLKEASMYLQNIGVAEHQCSEAIRISVQTITDKMFSGNLPSRSTQCRLPSEMKALALKHVANETKDKENLTLKYDGITDSRGRHITEVEVATGQETYLLGLRAQPSGTADDYANTIKDTLHSIDNASGAERGTLLSQILNTMTDRHIVNQAVDRSLENSKGSKINQFRCFMHPLDTFQKQCNQVLKEEENKDIKEKYSQVPFTHRNESMTQALIRTIDKLFHNQEINIGRDLHNYIRSTIPGFAKKTLFRRWVGNKFNILFDDAKSAFFFAPTILHFLTKVCGSRNPAVLAVINLLEGNDCAVQLQCLGLVGTFITGPWETLAKCTHLNILDVNQHIFTAHQQIQQWIQDPTPLLQGQATSDCFGKEINHSSEDNFLNKAQGASSEEAVELLKKLLQAIDSTILRQLADHLPDGKFWEPSESLIKQAKSTDATNITGERDFGLYKSLQANAPAMTVEKAESKELFKTNKLMKSMLSKTSEERRKEILWATKEGAKIRRIDQERAKTYQEKMHQRLAERRKIQTDREERRRQTLEEIVLKVHKFGRMWTTSQDVINHTTKLSETQKKEALKSQIKLRTTLLQYESNKIAISKVTSAELQHHLEDIISSSSVPDDVINETRAIESIIEAPRSLVNSRIQQKFEDATTGFETLYKGTVTKMIDNEFEIAYDESPTDVCYQTIEEVIVDLAAGDMTIL